MIQGLHLFPFFKGVQVLLRVVAEMAGSGEGVGGGVLGTFDVLDDEVVAPRYSSLLIVSNMGYNFLFLLKPLLPPA